MDGAIELELLVGDDFTGAALLIGEDAVLEGDDGGGGADGGSLGGNVFGDIVGSDFKGAGVVFVTAVAGLSRDGGGESGEEGDGSEGLHDDDDEMKMKILIGCG